MRILVADDKVLLTDLLAIYMGRLGTEFSVETVQDLATLLQCPAEPSPDLIIIDLQMPGMHGLAGLTAARRHFPGVPVALLSTDIAEETLAAAMTAGAAGVIPMTIGGEAMVGALRAMARGERFFPAVRETSGEFSHAPAPGSSSIADAVASMTKREREVLRWLCTGASNGEIGKTLRLEPVTVGLYLRKVYRKLGVHSRGQAIRLCLESGLEL